MFKLVVFQLCYTLKFYQTPFLCSILKGNIEIVKLLLKSDEININTPFVFKK